MATAVPTPPAAYTTATPAGAVATGSLVEAVAASTGIRPEALTKAAATKITKRGQVGTADCLLQADGSCRWSVRCGRHPRMFPGKGAAAVLDRYRSTVEPTWSRSASARVCSRMALPLTC